MHHPPQKKTWLLGEIEVEALCSMPYCATHFRGLDDFFGQPVRRGVCKSEFWDLRVKTLAGCAKKKRSDMEETCAEP